MTEPLHVNAVVPDEERLTIAELITAIRRFGVVDRIPLVVSVAVAPDVWTFLRATIPSVRGSSLTTMGITVFSLASLPRGAVVPLDENGKPIPKPKATAEPEPFFRPSDPPFDQSTVDYSTTRGVVLTPGIFAENIDRLQQQWRQIPIPAQPLAIVPPHDDPRVKVKPRVTFPVPHGTPLTRCVSCHAPIFWIVTGGGARMPVDAESHESHFASCPYAGEHRKPRKKKR